MSEQPIFIDTRNIDFSDNGWFEKHYRVQNYKDNAVKAHDLLKESPIIFFGDKYKETFEPFFAEIKDRFDNYEKYPDEVEIWHSYKGQPLRLYYVGPLMQKIEAILFEEFGYPASSSMISRTIPLVIADEDYKRHPWPAEAWHTDLPCTDEQFQFAIYMDDTDENHGAFEFAYPPEENFFSTDQYLTEFPDNNFLLNPKDSRKALGKAGDSFLFAGNLAHKGNYPTDGKPRDSMIIGFRFRTIGEKRAETGREGY